MREVVDTQLPVTMVGSYPRPLWYKHQLHGQDIQHAFKLEEHAQAYEDATAACIRDQEEAGLDIVADGQMYFDDYGGRSARSSGIGTSACRASITTRCSTPSPCRGRRTRPNSMS